MEKDLKNNILKYLLMILLIVIILNISMLFNSQQKENEVKENELKFLREDNSTYVEMKLPAVDSEGNGVTTVLSVEVSPGNGKTLIDINNLLFFADTQHSIRIAKNVAEKITEKNMNNYNLVYGVEANASLIGGPSAGAALTIATIAAVEGKQIRKDVMITGAVNSDGSIGPVGEILAKAKAAKEAGASIFLVPLLQSRDVIYDTVESCEKFGASEICTTETRPRKVNVIEETGINVVEVASVEEALKYFY